MDAGNVVQPSNIVQGIVEDVEKSVTQSGLLHKGW